MKNVNKNEDILGKEIVDEFFGYLDKITDKKKSVATKRSNQVGCESKPFFSGWEVVK